MKTKTGKIALLLAGIALACLALGGTLVEWSDGWVHRPGHGRVIDLERTYPSAGLTAIDLGTVASDIYCHSGGGDRIQVRLSGETNSTGEPFELATDLRGGLLSIEVRPRRNRIVNLDFTRATLEVIVPGRLGSDLDIHTTSGDVRLEGLRLKKLGVRTVSGDFRSREVTAETSVLRTVSGYFQLEGRPGDLNFRGISGNLDARYLEFANDLELGSTSGQIRLDLPPASAFSLDASSVSGEITSDFPIAITGGRDQRRLAGTVGNGTNRIKITTVSGGIRLF